jgi:hypothetical protein
VYQFALFVHLLGVVILVAAVTTTLVSTLRAQTARSVEQIRTLTAVTAKIDILIGPAMLLILAPGLYMVARGGDDGTIHWTSGWVDTAIAVFLLMSVLGPTVESRHAKHLSRLAAELPDGPVPTVLDDLRRRPLATHVTLFGASQIVAFLYLMTTKPTLLGGIAACVLAAAVSALLAGARLRSLKTARPFAASRPSVGQYPH